MYRQGADGERQRLSEGLLSGLLLYEFVDESAPETEVDYWLQEVSLSGTLTWLGSATLPPAPPVSVDVRLAQSQPNPSSSTRRLTYSLPHAARTRLSVYDVRGGLVIILVDRVMPAGKHTVSWDGCDSRGEKTATGVYFVRLEAGGQVKAAKIVLSR